MVQAAFYALLALTLTGVGWTASVVAVNAGHILLEIQEAATRISGLVVAIKGFTTQSDQVLHGHRFDLLELTAVVAAAARVVCGDTGVAHLATALGTPSVVLFGPTSPARWQTGRCSG